MRMTGGGPGSVESCGRPSWLQTTLGELDEKMKALAVNLQDEEDSDSFAKRAENYYRKRPQLLNLLQDIYNNYLSLADRYCRQSLTKHSPHSSQTLTLHSDIEDESESYLDAHHNPSDSDAESTLSYQTPPPSDHLQQLDPDNLIAELVVKTVDYEFVLNELGILERGSIDSSRKMKLQKSLLEVLESERLVLLNENARLGYQATRLAEENKGLLTESALVKRKASELARCVLKMREDHRVCLLSRKIEHLQGQINGLEKRNKEYYEQLVRREEEEKEKNKRREMVALEVCFEVEKLKNENQRLKEEAKMVKKGSSSKWWGKVKKLDMFLVCGPNYNPTSPCC